MSPKKGNLVIVSLIILITSISVIAEARSVYVISNTGGWPGDTPIIQAYRIQDSNLVYQTDYNSVHPLAVGLAIDTDSECLFITHEYGQEPGNQIEIVNAKTMKYVDTVTATGASNLPCIVVRHSNRYLSGIWVALMV